VYHRIGLDHDVAGFSKAPQIDLSGFIQHHPQEVSAFEGPLSSLVVDSMDFSSARARLISAGEVNVWLNKIRMELT
jgi:hypothetical protein